MLRKAGAFMEKIREMLSEHVGEISALFMSQDIPGTQIVMPLEALNGIVDKMCDAIKAEMDAKDREVEQLRVQLAGCGVAALGGTSDAQVVKQGQYGWSPAYQDVLNLRIRHDLFEKWLEGTLTMNPATDAEFLNLALIKEYFQDRYALTGKMPSPPTGAV